MGWAETLFARATGHADAGSTVGKRVEGVLQHSQAGELSYRQRQGQGCTRKPNEAEAEDMRTTILASCALQSRRGSPERPE
jgi:hypothetical protein